jgi:nucleotidyltransferase/DNA polymerase involved in DNA repair
LGVVGDFAAASGSDPAGSGGEDEGYSSRDDWQPSDEDEYEDACCGEARPRPRRRPRRRNEVEELLSMHALAEQVVSEIRARVARVTGGLTVSAGIAPNAKLAKMGADVNKPNGQTRIGNSVDAILSFLRDQPLRKVPFVGRVMIAC